MSINKTEPSICIPRVFSSVTWREVKDTFEQILGKGCVERVDVVTKTTDDGESYGRVFIHFRHWPRTEEAQEMRRQLMDGGFVKIVYDDPWYWKCSKSRVPKPNRERAKAAPYVELVPKRSDPVPSADFSTLTRSSGDEDAMSRADTDLADAEMAATLGSQ